MLLGLTCKNFAVFMVSKMFSGIGTLNRNFLVWFIVIIISLFNY